MTAGRPLEGKRLVITRAVEQAKEAKRLLEQLGATVLLLPAISFSAPADTEPLDRAIGSLKSFDWVFFTSANAVRFFAERCRKLGSDYASGKKPQCAAVGFATASAVTGEGIAVDYVAQEFRGEALARELGGSLAGKRILLPRSDRAGSDLPEALRKAGAEVTEAVAYLTGGASGADPEVVQAVREGRVDVISFYSPSAVENVRSLLGAELLLKLGERVAFSAVGPVTAAALRSAGLRVAIEAEKATAEATVNAIIQYFASPPEAQARPI
jgi:uroporphyrinogen III methyltransferase / synthase